jgi:hypothetical protein
MTDNIEQIKTEYETERAKLFDQAGQPIYAPAEQERRQTALKEELTGKVNRIVESCQGEIATLQSQLKVVAAPVQPLDNLSEAELSRANARREFVKEDISSLTLGELAKRLAALLEGNDKATLFLYGRYLPTRLKSLNNLQSSQPDARTLAALQAEAEARLTTLPDTDKTKELKKRLGELQSRQGAARLVLQETTQPRRQPMRL